MSIVKIKSNKPSVKPFYKGYVLDDNNYNRKHKVILLRKLYFYYLKMSQNEVPLKIDSNANIDEAIYFLFHQFERFKDYTAVLEYGSFDIGIQIKTAYDSGCIPLKAFYDERKNKPFYDFLLRIVGFLKLISCSVFNDYISEMAIEELENRLGYDDTDEACEARYALKTYKKLIEPMINEADKRINLRGGIRFEKLEFEQYAKENPKWYEFIKDFEKVWNQDFCFHHMDRLNIDEDAREEGFLDLDGLFHFSWEYRYADDEHVLDTNIDFWKRSQSQNGYWAHPFVTVAGAKGKFDKDYFKKEEKKCTNLLNLFLKYYDCFDYRQR